MMKFKLQLVIDDEQGQSHVTEIIQLEKANLPGYCAGLSLTESKQIVRVLQKNIVLQQADAYIHAHRACPCCHQQRRIKGHHTIQYNTLFGTVVIPDVRLYQCPCQPTSTKTFSLLHAWLPEHTNPELTYIETKWASHVSFDKTASLLADVLPIAATHNGVTVRNHLHKIAKKQEAELEGKPRFISGCANEWAKLPKPDKLITIGIDGGYVRSCDDKRANFEVLVGKSYSKTQPTKRFGLVQTMDEQPQRRLLQVLRSQGMQENQQITFLSDGADNMRELQWLMHPESEHVLDWFHLTMRFTVLGQFTKGLIKTDAEAGKEVEKQSTRAKWYLWHGNVKEGLACLDDCYCWCDDDGISYKNQKKMLKHVDELMTYVGNNRHLIPNYGEKWRYGETIASSFVESTVNEVVTKRMVKKQQMQWSRSGAHYLLQARTATLNGELPSYFERWYPGLVIDPKPTEHAQKLTEDRLAA